MNVIMLNNNANNENNNDHNVINGLYDGFSDEFIDVFQDLGIDDSSETSNLPEIYQKYHKLESISLNNSKEEFKKLQYFICNSPKEPEFFTLFNELLDFETNKNGNNIQYNSEQDLINSKLVLDWIQYGPVFQRIHYFSKQSKLNKKYNDCENLFGTRFLNIFLKIKKLPSKNNNQWTTILGENIAKIILESKGFILSKTKNINQNDNQSIPKKVPDWIITDNSNKITGIVEVKSRTYTTPGTVGEKLLFPCVKYDNNINGVIIPFFVFCVGYQEIEAHFDLQFLKKSQKLYNLSFTNELFELFNKHKKYYVGASDILKLSQNKIIDEYFN